MVGPGASRRWVFLFRWDGKLKEMGLGGLASVPLADARRKAEDARRATSPSVATRYPSGEPRKPSGTQRRRSALSPMSSSPTISHGFRNAKHAAQWAMTLKTYAAPIRDKDLDDITTDDVLAVLKPIWQTKNETASRLRGRIERVLDAAKARGLRQGENPARWRGHLQSLLTPRQTLARGHHAAMPYDDVPAFLARLRLVDGCVGAGSRVLHPRRGAFRRGARRAVG